MGASRLIPPDLAVGNWYVSQSFEEKKSVATGRGVLHSLLVSNKNASTVYIYVYDNTAASGTVLITPIAVPTNSSVAVDVGFGKGFSTGLYVASSSTLGTYTALSANDISMTVGWGAPPSVP